MENMDVLPQQNTGRKQLGSRERAHFKEKKILKEFFLKFFEGKIGKVENKMNKNSSFDDIAMLCCFKTTICSQIRPHFFLLYHS